MKRVLKEFGGRAYFAVFLVLFGLIFIRYCYYGLTYFPQLDDYIQYHNYTAFNSDLPKLMSNLGLLSSRPLAGLSDLYVWSHFYGCMIAAVAIISALYAASCVFLHSVFRRRFGTGWLFFVIYALLPMAFEGTYWVSASSRIVVGLFFASAALLCFDKWCESGNRLQLAGFAVLQLAAFCYYEQVLLFSAAATLVIMLCCAKPVNRRALWGFLMFPNAVIYFVLTKLAPAGVYSSRAVLFFPWQESYIQFLFDPLIDQISDATVGASAAIGGRGLLRGFKLLLSQPNFIYIFTVLLLCALFWLLMKNVRRDSEVRVFPELLAGLLLTAAPALIFFVLKDAWFGLRNVVPSLCGLALILDALFDLVFGWFKKGGAIQAVLVSVLCLLCCAASISELHDYRETTLADTAIASAAGEAVGDSKYSKDTTILMLNVDASYAVGANYYFHEHGYGVTGSDWALTGAARALSGRGDIPMLTPVSQYRTYYSDDETIRDAVSFFYYSGVFVPVTLEKTNSGFDIESAAGHLGHLRRADDGFYLEPKQ